MNSDIINICQWDCFSRDNALSLVKHMKTCSISKLELGVEPFGFWKWLPKDKYRIILENQGIILQNQDRPLPWTTFYPEDRQVELKNRIIRIMQEFVDNYGIKAGINQIECNMHPLYQQYAIFFPKTITEPAYRIDIIFDVHEELNTWIKRGFWGELENKLDFMIGGYLHAKYFLKQEVSIIGEIVNSKL